MEYVNLGNTDIKVSKVCLGCMGFGDPQAGMHSWTLPYEESKKIIKHALDQGINFFDTAMGYQGGTSEEYLGRAIKEFSKREDVVIATKFMPRSQVQIDQGVSAREHIETCLNNSLKRLQMDYVDLYILHRWDNVTPIKETMEILNDLVKLVFLTVLLGKLLGLMKLPKTMDGQLSNQFKDITILFLEKKKEK